MCDKIVKGSDIIRNVHLQHDLSQYLLEHIRSHENTLIMIDEAAGKELWSENLISESLKLASLLQQRWHIKSDDVVGIIFENRVEFVTISLAVLLVGAIVTTFNPLATKEELRHLCRISKPRLVFTADFCAKNIAELQDELHFIDNVVDIDSNLDQYSVESGGEVYSFNSLFQDGAARQYKPICRKPNDVVLILYSSGTTGLPKGVALTNENIIHILEVTKLGFAPTVIGDYTITTIPLFSSYGILVTSLAIVIRFCLVVMKSFDESTILSYIQKYKIKFLYMTPSLVYRLLDSPLVDSFDLSSLEAIVSGGALLNSVALNLIKARLNVKQVYQGYGMTELAVSGIQCRPNSVNKIGSCGYLLPAMKCKIVDVETGELLGPMETGELYFKGPLVMKGYYDNEEETNKVIDSEGWFRSGDIGYYDEDGAFFIVDRLKDVIKYNEYQVSPSQLESIILRLKEVKDVAVVGIPDERAGELPKAFVVKQPGANITEEYIIQQVADNVSPQKRLAGGVQFVDEIPKLGSGKVLRRVLKKLK